MKFAMLIVEREEDREAPSAAEQEFETLVRWWSDLRAKVKVVASARLAPRRTARTVSWRNQVPVVTDGPYVEAKESVGGILVVEVESEAEALEIAKAWPTTDGYRIEVRPVVEI
jgi:hypothetical protein